MQPLVHVRDEERATFGVLTGLVVAFGVARNLFAIATTSLFLERYAIAELPFVYVVGAGVTAATWLAFEATEQHVGPRRARAMSATLLAASLMLTWGALQGPASTGALLFAMVWQYGAAALATLTGWGLAVRTYAVRTERRLFAPLLASELLAGAFAGALAWALPAWIAPVHLVAIAAGFASAGLVGLTWSPLAPSLPPEPAADELLAVTYPSRLLTFLGVSVIAGQLLDFLFFAVAQQELGGAVALTRFFGLVTGMTDAATAGALVLLAPQLLEIVGTRATVLLFPVMTTLSLCAAWWVQHTTGAGEAFFWTVTGVIVLDRLLRGSLERAAVYTLHQPLTPRIRADARSTADGVMTPIATGGTGAVLLLFSGWWHHPEPLLAGLLGVLAAWAMAAWRVGVAYQVALARSFELRCLWGEHVLLRDAAATRMLLDALDDGDPRDALYALHLLDETGHPELEPALVRQLAHPDPALRRDALARLQDRRPDGLAVALASLVETESDPEVLAVATRILLSMPEVPTPSSSSLLDHPDARVRRAALAGLSRHPDTAEASEAWARATDMVNSLHDAERREAARSLGVMGGTGPHRLLVRLFEDEEPSVRRTAIRAAGHCEHPAIWAPLVELLDQDADRAAAFDALCAIGPRIVPTLCKRFERVNSPPVRLTIVRTAARLGGDDARRFLLARLADPDRETRDQAASALAQMVLVPDERALVHAKALEEGELVIRLLRAMEACDDRRVLASLFHDAEAAVTRHLHLLEALGWRDAALQLRLVRAQPDASHPLDASIPADLAAIAVPMVQRGEARLARLVSVCGDAEPPKGPWLAALAAEHQPGASRWTRLCAVDAITRDRPAWARAVLSGLCNDADPILAEASERALARLDGFDPKETKTAMLQPLERVLLLKSVDLFAAVSDDALVSLAGVLDELRLPAGTEVTRQGEPGLSMYFVVSGRLRVVEDGDIVGRLGPRGVIGELSVLDPRPRRASATAESEVLLLRLRREALQELATTHGEVAWSIIGALCQKLRATRELAPT